MRWVAAACAVILFPGCGDDADNGAPSGERGDPTAAVQQYVAAISAGDADAAMALRCDDATVPRDRRSTFDADLERLVETAGELTATDVNEIEPTGLQSSSGAPSTEIEFSLRWSDGTSPPLLTAVVEADGRYVLCGIATSASLDFRDDVPPIELLPGDSPTDLRSVLDGVPAPRGHTLKADTETPQEDLEGAEQGWARTWDRTAGFGGAVAFLAAYPTAEAAREATHEDVATAISDSIEMFDPGRPGTVGLRVLAHAWTWSQPPDSPPYLDVVHAVIGTTRIYVAVTVPEPDPSHHIAIALFGRVASSLGP